MQFTEAQLAGLKALRDYTRGTFNPWQLAGDQHAKQRQYVLTMLGNGAKPLRAQCGVTALESKFLEITDATGSCKADRLDNAADKARAALG